MIEGLKFFGTSLATDGGSAYLTLDGVRAFYVDHSNRATQQYGSQSNTGMAFRGRGHVIRNCEIACSSGNCVVLFGRDCLVVNNYIHDGNYMGTYAAPFAFGRGASDNVVSHNTITRSGRTTVNTSGFYRSLLQYNDISFAGYLSYDLGLTYANGVEGGNSEVRYNWLHDNVAEHVNMGLYFDHGCKKPGVSPQRYLERDGLRDDQQPVRKLLAVLQQHRVRRQVELPVHLGGCASEGPLRMSAHQQCRYK